MKKKTILGLLLIWGCSKPSISIPSNTNTTDTTINIATGLIAYYPFNDNANDYSGNNNNGILHGAISIADRFGHTGSAYAFNMNGDTSDYIDVPNSSSLQPDSAISIAAWVYINDSTTNNFERMVSKQEYQSQNYSSYQLIAGNEGQDSLGFTGLTVRTTNSYNWTGHSGTSFINKWVYVCGTWDGVNMKFYQNGILTKTISQRGKLIYDNEDLWIAKGLDGLGHNEYFKGYLDDIRIYSRALNQHEVTYLASFVDTTHAISPPNNSISFVLSTWMFNTWGYNPISHSTDTMGTIRYSEDSTQLLGYLAKWDSTSNTLWCKGDSSNSLENISQVNIYFKDKPIANRIYSVISQYWDGLPTNDSVCAISFKSTSDGAYTWYSVDSSQHVNIAINNGKITASLLHYISVEKYIGNTVYDAMLSGTLIEK